MTSALKTSNPETCTPGPMDTAIFNTAVAPEGPRDSASFRNTGLVGQITARLTAYRCDRQLVAGVVAEAGSALAAHAARLVSSNERTRLTNSMKELLARANSNRMSARMMRQIEPNYGPVANAQALIGSVIDRLADARPVSAAGVARLRVLISDGVGPLYLGGGGNLTEELQTVMAEL